MQDEVIPDQRFITPGLRNEGGFIGAHDRMTGMPLPDHISANPKDLDSLMGGMIETYALFPVSAVILERIEAYKKILEHFSKRRLGLLEARYLEIYSG